MIILGKTKISVALKEHPELKKVLMGMSPKFNKLENNKIFGIVSKWATFNDVAKVGKISICELLHTLNNEIGNEDKLYLSFPECIKELEKKKSKSVKPVWIDEIKQLIIFDVRELDSFFLPKIVEKQKKLKSGQALQVINDFDPVPLKRMLEENGDTFYLEELKNGEFHLFIKYKKVEKLTNENWKDNIEQFEEINAIGMKEDPFEMIVKKAQSLQQGEGFVLKQIFEPTPLINMLTGMGFKYFTEQKETFRFLIYFFKTITKDDESIHQTDKVSVVIQSATPITYPIIMKMLQSKRLMDEIEIKELKVWEETEKHMAWVMNKKADITFSAVAAAAKLYLSGVDIKMYSINIWDNFHLLTRGYDAKSFEDIKGHKIHVPLFKQAPPMVMTKHLIEANGYSIDDFEFTFGDPFGRPEEIKNDFIAGNSDTVLLREPEASYAMYNAKDVYESISYSQLWKEDGNKIGNIPNAGLIFKGEFLREHPDVAEVFVEELEKATKWVVENKKEAAEMAFDIMRHKPEEIELFLKRAHFEHVKSDEILDEIVHYLQVLNDNEKYTKNSLKGLFQVDLVK